LSLLSYTSILGLISIIFLIAVVIVDGAFKMEAPGSFWDPAETTFGVVSTNKLGLAFGLFMAGVSSIIYHVTCGSRSTEVWYSVRGARLHPFVGEGYD